MVVPKDPAQAGWLGGLESPSVGGRPPPPVCVAVTVAVEVAEGRSVKRVECCRVGAAVVERGSCGNVMLQVGESENESGK